MITILAEIETKCCRTPSNIHLLETKTRASPPISAHDVSLFQSPLREGPGGTLALPWSRSFCEEQRAERGRGWLGRESRDRGNGISTLCTFPSNL